MSFHNTRRLHKSISPLGERNITPDNNSKYCGQTMGQSNINSTVNVPCPKEFSENLSAYSNKNRYHANRRQYADEDVFNHTLAQINLELDNNMNEIIYLLGRRKTLTAAKKKRIKEEYEERTRGYSSDRSNSFEYYDDEEFMRVVNFCQNTEVGVKILTKIVTMLGSIRGSKADEQDKSQAFWAKNRQLENQMDSMIEKLKSIDKSLEKENKDVLEICKSLDNIQDTLKSIVGIKGEDNLDKVEPLFNSKKKNYDCLNMKIKERQRFKDSKIQNIKRIFDALNHLKQTRENRLNQIAKFFGLSNIWDFDKLNFRDAGDFAKGFEELLRVKQKEQHLNGSLKQIMDDIDRIESQQDQIYNELLKKQSDEARAYHNYSKKLGEKKKYSSILSLFSEGSGNNKIFTLSEAELSKKFGEYKNFLKRFLEEDFLIKQGLVKTCETLQTFVTLQKATENQKQRRHELLMILETYIHKKADYSHKKQELRTLLIEDTKNQQKLSEYEEELQVILADGDIDSYKKIGNLIAQCELDRSKLIHRREKLEKQMEIMDRQVVGMTSKIKEEYEDILCEIVPSDYEYELADGEDVRKLRNYLRKMYRRLGILGNQ